TTRPDGLPIEVPYAVWVSVHLVAVAQSCDTSGEPVVSVADRHRLLALDRMSTVPLPVSTSFQAWFAPPLARWMIAEVPAADRAPKRSATSPVRLLSNVSQRLAAAGRAAAGVVTATVFV